MNKEEIAIGLVDRRLSTRCRMCVIAVSESFGLKSFAASISQSCRPQPFKNLMDGCFQILSTLRSRTLGPACLQLSMPIAEFKSVSVKIVPANSDELRSAPSKVA